MKKEKLLTSKHLKGKHYKKEIIETSMFLENF